MTGYPFNPANPDTQVGRAYEIIVNRGEAIAPDFLNAKIPDYRRRVTDLEELLRPWGWTVLHRREPGNRYVHFSIVKIAREADHAA